MNELFRKFAQRTSAATGSPWAFLLASLTILIWIVTGPVFKYSDTWQLVINTGTTIVTFLMVFLIQNTQNRDAAALHLKLDELIRSVGAARDGLIDVEHLSDEELKKLQDSFSRLREKKGGDVEECLEAVETVAQTEAEVEGAAAERRIAQEAKETAQ
jgi:low affinity Fe/Cu permease